MSSVLQNNFWEIALKDGINDKYVTDFLCIHAIDCLRASVVQSALVEWLLPVQFKKQKPLEWQKQYEIVDKVWKTMTDITKFDQNCIILTLEYSFHIVFPSTWTNAIENPKELPILFLPLDALPSPRLTRLPECDPSIARLMIASITAFLVSHGRYQLKCNTIKECTQNAWTRMQKQQQSSKLRYSIKTGKTSWAAVLFESSIPCAWDRFYVNFVSAIHPELLEHITKAALCLGLANLVHITSLRRQFESQNNYGIDFPGTSVTSILHSKEEPRCDCGTHEAYGALQFAFGNLSAVKLTVIR